MMFQSGAKESMLIQVQLQLQLLLVQESVATQVRGRDVAKVLEVVVVGRAGAGLGHGDASRVMVRIVSSQQGSVCGCDANIGGRLVARWGIGQGMGGSVTSHIRDLRAVGKDG
jgi:hypothetical protein